MPSSSQRRATFVSGLPIAAAAKRTLAVVIFGLRPPLRPRPTTGKARGEVGGRRRIDQRGVPLQEDLEIRVSEEGRTVLAHQQEERGFDVVRGQRLAVRLGHAPPGPFCARVPDRQVRLLPWHLRGYLQLLGQQKNVGARCRSVFAVRCVASTDALFARALLGS